MEGSAGGSQLPQTHVEGVEKWIPKEWLSPEEGIGAVQAKAFSAVHYPLGREPKCFPLNCFWPDPWSQANMHPLYHFPYYMR